MIADTEQVIAFLRGQDFLKLGRAIKDKNWAVAMMTYRRMDQQIKRLELTEMQNNLNVIRGAILEKNSAGGLNAMAQLTAKRVALIKKLDTQ